jgi:hypothetical protein
MKSWLRCSRAVVNKILSSYEQVYIIVLDASLRFHGRVIFVSDGADLALRLSVCDGTASNSPSPWGADKHLQRLARHFQLDAPILTNQV